MNAASAGRPCERRDPDAVPGATGDSPDCPGRYSSFLFCGMNRHSTPRLAVSFAAAMLLNIPGCKLLSGRAKDVWMVCWYCYSCRRHLFRCVISAVTPGIGRHEPVQTSTGCCRCDKASKNPTMRHSHRKQSTLLLSFAEAACEHLFSQLRLNRQSRKGGARVRTIVRCGQENRGPMRKRQPIAAHSAPCAG